jgi:fluoroquinolone transport system permease protein
MRLARQLKTDILFQFRQGFYYAYIFITVFYGVIIMFLPTAYRQVTALFLILSDTSVLGFFFIGGVVLLEKRQSLLTNVAVTPLSISEYIASKCLSFLILITGSSLAVQACTGLIPENPALFVYAVVLSGTLYTLFGLMLGTLAKSLNQYFALSMGFLVFFIPSATYILQLTPQTIFTAFPLTAAYLLFQSALTPAPLSLWSMAGLLLWNIIFFGVCYLVLYRYIYGSLRRILGRRRMGRPS